MNYFSTSSTNATFVALAGEASLYEELGVDSGANDKEIKFRDRKKILPR